MHDLAPKYIRAYSCSPSECTVFPRTLQVLTHASFSRRAGWIVDMYMITSLRALEPCQLQRRRHSRSAPTRLPQQQHWQQQQQSLRSYRNQTLPQGQTSFWVPSLRRAKTFPLIPFCKDLCSNWGRAIEQFCEYISSAPPCLVSCPWHYIETNAPAKIKRPSKSR